jgi:hypothetical protein
MIRSRDSGMRLITNSFAVFRLHLNPPLPDQTRVFPTVTAIAIISTPRVTINDPPALNPFTIIIIMSVVIPFRHIGPPNKYPGEICRIKLVKCNRQPRLGEEWIIFTLITRKVMV